MLVMLIIIAVGNSIICWCIIPTANSFQDGRADLASPTDPPIRREFKCATLGRFAHALVCDLLLQDACENRAGWLKLRLSKG